MSVRVAMDRRATRNRRMPTWRAMADYPTKTGYAATGEPADLPARTIRDYLEYVRGRTPTASEIIEFRAAFATEVGRQHDRSATDCSPPYGSVTDGPQRR
jgi:hypothetical protein